MHSIHNRRSKVPKLVLYLRGHQILDSTFRSPEPWLSPVQCLALLQIVRDHCASAEVVVAQPSCLSICCARPAEAAELLGVTEPPGQWRERRTDINRCALVARVTMIVEAAVAAGGKNAGGGRGGKKASKPVRVFVQATSLAQTMPAVKTGMPHLANLVSQSRRTGYKSVFLVYPFDSLWSLSVSSSL